MPARFRCHLVELEDLSWFPSRWRDYVTDFLSIFFATARPYDCVLPLLDELIVTSGASRIVDLCSGGGTPSRRVFEKLRAHRNLELILTDKFPNRDAITRHRPHYQEQALDILKDPIPTGLRTLFTAFHHFDPTAARQILERAVKDEQPIALFEITERSWRGLIAVCFVPLLVLLLTPFIRPIRWQRFALTYLAPVVPFCALWDGVVSTFRSYTEDELRAMTDGLASFAWHSGVMSTYLGTRVTYLIGRPCSPQLKEIPSPKNNSD